MTASKWRVKSCGDGVALNLAFSTQYAGSIWIRASPSTMADSKACTDVVVNASESDARGSTGTGEANGDAESDRLPEDTLRLGGVEGPAGTTTGATGLRRGREEANDMGGCLCVGLLPLAVKGRGWMLPVGVQCLCSGVVGRPSHPRICAACDVGDNTRMTDSFEHVGLDGTSTCKVGLDDPTLAATDVDRVGAAAMF
jgi:hypothetical protein